MKLAKKRKQVIFDMAGNRIVITLVNAWKHGFRGELDIVDFLNVLERVIRDTELYPRVALDHLVCVKSNGRDNVRV